MVEAAYSLKELLCVLVEVVGVVFGVGVEVVLRAEVPVAAVPAVVATSAVESAPAVIAAATVETTSSVIATSTVKATTIVTAPAVEASPAVTVSATVITSAWTTLRLNVAFRLRSEGAHRESHLACLGVYLKKFNVNFLTNSEYVLNILCLVPSDLGHVEKAFLAREDLDERAELKD